MNIYYIDHITNNAIRERVTQAIGTHDDLLTVVKKRKLKWYGHTSRSSGMSKTILQGTTNGKRRRGRQRKRWEDNIREWTGLTFAESQRISQNRNEWKAIVNQISLVPLR